MTWVKQILSRTWNEFIYGGHLLSVGLAGIILSVEIILDLPKEWPLFIISYFLSQIIYCHNHLSELSLDLSTNPERALHMQKSKEFLTFIFFAYIFLIIFFSVVAHIDEKLIIFIILLLVSGILYTTFFKSCTKSIVAFKNLYVALAWALAGIFLPLFYYSLSFDLTFLLLFLFIFIKWLVNTAFFDLKDIDSDRKLSLRTLPVTFGVRKTLRFLYILNALSLVPLLIGSFWKLLPSLAMGLAIFFFYDLYYLKKAKAVNSKDLRSLSYIFVDGEYILWPAVLLIIKSFPF